jgi:hypothetical protein
MTFAPLVVAALGSAPSPELLRLSRSYVQTLAAPPERVLPLLTPLGERSWAPGWEPELRWQPPHGAVGTLFVIRHPGEPETVWLLDTFDPGAGHVHYLHLTPGSDVTEIDIQLHPGPEKGTRAEVRYTWTALTEAGNAKVRRHTPEEFLHSMQSWERQLNHYLQTGKRLERPHP